MAQREINLLRVIEAADEILDMDKGITENSFIYLLERFSNHELIEAYGFLYRCELVSIQDLKDAIQQLGD